MFDVLDLVENALVHFNVLDALLLWNVLVIFDMLVLLVTVWSDKGKIAILQHLTSKYRSQSA